MRNKLLISTGAAACLMLGVAAVSAQGPGSQGTRTESGAAGTSQGMQGGAASGGMNQGGSAEHHGAGGSAQVGKSGEKSNQSAQSAGTPLPAQSQGGGQRAQSSQAQQRDQGMQAQQRDQGMQGRDKNPSTEAQQNGSRSGQNAAQQGAQTNQGMQPGQAGSPGRVGAAGQAGVAGQAGASGKSSATTTESGGAAGSNVTLNTKQKTKIRETVINSGNAPRLTNVNFSLSVGTVVPQTVRFAPVPAALVEINPGWHSYEYFIVQEEIIIIDPRTRRIITILPV